MATQPAIFDYTNRDYSSLLASLLDTAAVKLPEWTDRSENDLGRLLLELMAQLGDVILYYQDRIANEAFLSTAVERRSVIDLVALIGYTLGTPSPASAGLQLRAANDSATPVQVDPGARFSTQATPTSPAVEFVYLPVTGAPLVVPRDGAGGSVSFSLTAVNAVQVAEEIVGVSTGDANQSWPLSQGPVLLPPDPDSQAYLRVEVDPGSGFQVWQRHGTLLYSRSIDQDFVVKIDDSDNAEVVFGDGTYGRIPPAGATIRATYLIGGGAAGNVGTNTITVAKSGVSVPVTVTNPLAASGGADRESIEHARALAPLVFRSQQRAVTSADYAALAENVPGVARAYAVAPQWNYVDVYVVAAGGTAPTDRLRADVFGYLQNRCMVTTLLSVFAPVFVLIDLTVQVTVEATFYDADVQQRVAAALTALFAIDQLRFGQSFYLSKVYEAVQSQAGVVAATVTTFAGYRSDDPSQQVDPGGAATGLIQLDPSEFPREGTITVTTSGGLA